MPLIAKACPTCGSPGQKFPVRKSLKRAIRTRCVNCGTRIESDVGKGKYALFFIYMHLVIPPLGALAIIGMSTANWRWTSAAVLLVAVIGYLPGLVLHILNPNVRSIESE